MCLDTTIMNIKNGGFVLLTARSELALCSKYLHALSY